MKRYKILAFFIVSVMSMMICGYTKEYDGTQDKVYDLAMLFTEGQIEELQQMCVKCAKGTKLDVGIVTTNDAQGKSSMAYADDFYDDMGFGYDNGASGIIMLIDMDNREVYLSTAGIAIGYFNDDDIDDVIDNLYGYITSGDYYNAAVSFIEDVERHVSYINNAYPDGVESWFDGDYTDYNDFENDYGALRKEKSIFAYPLADFFIAAFGSLIIVLIMCMNSKSKMTAGANTYINRDKLNVRRSMDTYLRTTVTKTKIQSSSGSSGGHSGGSHHRSSSGRSHGGGGRKF